LKHLQRPAKNAGLIELKCAKITTKKPVGNPLAF